METIIEWFQRFSNGLTETESKALTTLVLIILLWLIQRIITRSIMKLQSDLAINLFQFSIVEVGNWVREEQSTGRIIHIPNSKIFKAPLANYNEGLDYIWNEIQVLVTFESDWKKCKKILQETLNEHAPKVSEHAKKEL